MWKEICWKETLEHEGEPVLTLALSLPAPPEGCRVLRRAGPYYVRMGEAWKTRWRSLLYAHACMALKEARENSRPFQPWEAELSYSSPLENESFSSFRVDAVERRSGNLPLTVRQADTWDLKTGLPRTLPSFFPNAVRWQQSLKAELRRQAGERLRSGEFLLFPDAEVRVAAHFSPDHFYLSGEDLVLFYPMCSLGAPVEGIVEFSLPLVDFSDRLPQKKRSKQRTPIAHSKS